MKKLLLSFLILLIIGAGIGYYAYQIIFQPNVTIGSESYILTIPTGSEFDDLVSILETEKVIKNKNSFIQVSKWMKYGVEKVPPGKYTIKAKWSNRELISLLRSGKQTPVNVIFSNARTAQELTGKISSYLELDSTTLTNYLFDDATLQKIGYSKENVISLFIPNTYNLFWTIKKEDLLDRLIKESNAFWSKNDRETKAKALNLSKTEVSTLASIVEKESIRSDEKPTIAGLYLNRIRIGMPLQADPTVVFAMGDFSLQRILLKHLAFESPYNTYLNRGLPPGPICMPSISSIDAVLNYEKHNYVYFCAKPESNGGHLFAETLSQHNANARIYHAWLNKKGIK